MKLGLSAALAIAVAGVLLAPSRARADVSEAAPRPDAQFDFMNLLSHHGLHDLDDETWNAYGQLTLLGSWKLPVPGRADVGGSNSSLSPNAELSWTGTFTLFFAAKLWPGGEAYFVPEVIAEHPLSDLKGLGSAIQNFELQKNGTPIPQVYRSRAYLQQTFSLGGKRSTAESNPMQLGGPSDSRRIVVRLGNFSVIDFMDKNTYSGDLRQQFFNMAFLTYAAYDFVADARGYSWGGMVEAYYDDWALRFGRLAAPVVPNGLPLNFRLDEFYGDQIEIEHDHRLFGRPGAVRILGYRNRENMGKFRDAIAAFEADPMKNAANCGDLPNYMSANASAPDLCWVRKPNVKVGIGVNLEQEVAEDVGVFFRGMYSDGQTEVYSYTSTDRSIALGALAKGTLWRRPKDVTGVGFGMGWISAAHAAYLAMGGVDGFIGDGYLRQAPESVVEAFYSVNVVSSLWLALDYQHITNPAYNADRGPVDIFGARIHAEF